jgi:hypothetical protein
MMVATVRKAWLSANTVPSAVSMSHRRHAALAFITAALPTDAAVKLGGSCRRCVFSRIVARGVLVR